MDVAAGEVYASRDIFFNARERGTESNVKDFDRPYMKELEGVRDIVRMLWRVRMYCEY